MYYTYFPDNYEVVNKESVIMRRTSKNKFCALVASRWKFFREQSFAPCNITLALKEHI
jgi:hypothetical protein